MLLLPLLGLVVAFVVILVQEIVKVLVVVHVCMVALPIVPGGASVAGHHQPV